MEINHSKKKKKTDSEKISSQLALMSPKYTMLQCSRMEMKDEGWKFLIPHPNPLKTVFGHIRSLPICTQLHMQISHWSSELSFKCVTSANQLQKLKRFNCCDKITNSLNLWIQIHMEGQKYQFFEDAWQVW